MKIIVPGDLDRLKAPVEFKCAKCGCVFVADNDEYKSEFNQRENCSWYEVKCPYCTNWVNKTNM